jgi:hypothetical protein
MWRSMSPLQVGSGAYLAFAGWRGCTEAVAGDAWFVGSGWQQRSETLYRLAGEVTRKLAAGP